MTELFVDAVRVEQQERPSQPDRTQEGEEREDERKGRARPVASDEVGIVVGTYPEWDRAAGIDRPSWTTVWDVPPTLGETRGLERALDEVAAVRARIRRLVRGARIGRHVRLKRQPEGPELDLDATIEAAIARRAGNIPDTRVYRTTERRTRDLAVTILIDASESTRDRTGTDGASVLDVERLAVAALGEAIAALGDPFALRAFASAGREHVHFVRIKDFAEPYGPTAKARLAGLAPGLSTRLGAVLRHAGAEMAAVQSFRKLILVLTDGEPSDVDVSDPLDLVADARRATQVLKSRGIDVFGVTLDPAGIGSGAAVFGRNQNMPVQRLEDLPARLAELYFRLARR